LTEEARIAATTVSTAGIGMNWFGLLPNESRLSCGALAKDQIPLRALSASSAARAGVRSGDGAPATTEARRSLGLQRTQGGQATHYEGDAGTDGDQESQRPKNVPGHVGPRSRRFNPFLNTSGHGGLLRRLRAA